MFYQADASSEITGHGGANGTDILNEFDLSLLDERLTRTPDDSEHIPRGFQTPGLLLDGMDTSLLSQTNYSDWMPKENDPSLYTDFLLPQDSPTSSESLSPESFAQDYLPASLDADYPMADAPPAQRTAGHTAPRPGKVPVYMWPRQSDPEMEKKRQRALKAFNNRQKVFQREQAMQNQIACMAKIIRQLQAEKKALENKLAEVEAHLSVFRSGRNPGY